MTLLSDVVIFLRSIGILSRNGKFSECATISFSERHEDAVDTPALFQPHLKIRISLRDGRSVQELHVRSKDSIIEGVYFRFAAPAFLISRQASMRLDTIFINETQTIHLCETCMPLGYDATITQNNPVLIYFTLSLRLLLTSFPVAKK
jgi:hypothetical protein